MITTMLLTVLPFFVDTPAKAADVAWLSGCWELTRGTRHVLEQWTAPEGGTLMGVSRTVANGKTTEWEFLMIREGTGGLEYVAKPSGQAEAVFRSVSITKDEAVFENPEHDFPKRVAYRRQADGGVTATIEGPMNGQTRSIAFPYTRAVCGK